jgi:N-methylhydantoinase A
MGGTTAKICLIDDGKPQTARAFEIARVGRFRKGSGLPLRIPVIEMVEIGAGGGSIAHVDTMGRIAVGPESAGANPGPACYGSGGTQPTVTDANLALGRYDPARFAGGTMRLDATAAHDALAARVGSRLALTTEMAALGVVEMVDENMANAARVHAIESGKTYEGRTLIAFGGGGPVHACRVAEKVGIRNVLVPSGAGVGSAIGFLRAPVGYEVVRSLYQRLSSFDVIAVNTLLADMEAEAMEVVAQGSHGASITQSRIAYMRYVGQGHEIPVPLPARPLGEEDVPQIRAAYDSEYTRFYDRPVPGSDVEIMSYAVLVTTVPADDPGTPIAGDDAVFVPDAVPARTQFVRDTTSGEVAPWPVHDRAALTPGVHIVGPAIIAENETSTLVCHGWSATVNGLGYIELTREAT